MIYIKHRVNKIKDLVSNHNTELGFEIDLRSDVNEKGNIHLSHDPWIKGDNLIDWLVQYKKSNFNGPIIFNTKEDLLEEHTIEVCNNIGIKNYFFLDTTIPTTIKLSKRGIRAIACRYSLYEPYSFCDLFKEKIDWIWVDCFGGNPVENKNELLFLKKSFKLCMVSPELHGFPLEIDSKWINLAKLCDAICTKEPDKWQKHVDF